MKNIICLKWGDKYGPEYVNNLYRNVKKNTTIKHRFICITEDPTGIDEGVECLPLLTDDLTVKGWWQKLAFFQSKIHDIEGMVLFLDLDVLIIDNIDSFFEEHGNYICIKEWLTNKRNSSVFRFEVGQHVMLWDTFLEDRPDGMAPTKLKPGRRLLHGDQNWIDHHMPNCQTWPEGWCSSFKYTPLDGDCDLTGIKIVIFHGNPKPEEALEGFHKWKPTPWIKDYWFPVPDVIKIEDERLIIKPNETKEERMKRKALKKGLV